MIAQMDKSKGGTYILNEKERKLIELLHQVTYGQVTIYVEAGAPIRAEMIKQSIKF